MPHPLEELLNGASKYSNTWVSLPLGRIEARVNQITGELAPVEPWVNQIHPEDWDWFLDHWLWMDEFDYRLKMAGVEA